jgi:hypothetical protein
MESVHLPCLVTSARLYPEGAYAVDLPVITLLVMAVLLMVFGIYLGAVHEHRDTPPSSPLARDEAKRRAES